jgi:sulfate/thiosulfate transport system substrate-binding protein
MQLFRTSLSFLALGLALAACGGPEPLRLLNVSYDPTRELYQAVNQAFAAQWLAQTGQAVRVQQSHGGSGKQARAILDGLPADVATLALPLDIDALAQGGLLPGNWRARLPHGSSPFYSTIVFLVREPDPKGIRDWDDLLKPGVQVISANPKVSGGARCVYLAAWAWGLRQGGEATAEDYVRRLYAQMPVLDAGARAATTTFVERGIGDVLLTWENEAHLALHEHGGRGFRIVTPSQSLQADLPVAEMDEVTRANGRGALAQAYLGFLFSEAGQELAAQHHFRPRDPGVAARHAGRFPALKLLSVEQVAGSWQAAQARHFAAGALFDRLLEARR